MRQQEGHIRGALRPSPGGDLADSHPDLTPQGAGSVSCARASLLVGLAAQSAGQAAMHGMDLYMFRGVLSILGAVALGGCFAASAWWAGPAPQQADDAAEGSAAWGALALGPFLFLQFTLFANMGRVATLTGWDAPATTLLIQGWMWLGLAAVV